MQDPATTPTLFDTPTPLDLEERPLSTVGASPPTGGSAGWPRWIGRWDYCAKRSPATSPSGEVPRSATPSFVGAPAGLPGGLRGYEDQNDSDTLRSDPLLEPVLGRLPQTDGGGSRQPADDLPAGERPRC